MITLFDFSKFSGRESDIAFDLITFTVGVVVVLILFVLAKQKISESIDRHKRRKAQRKARLQRSS